MLDVYGEWCRTEAAECERFLGTFEEQELVSTKNSFCDASTSKIGAGFHDACFCVILVLESGDGFYETCRCWHAYQRCSRLSSSVSNAVTDAIILKFPVRSYTFASPWRNCIIVYFYYLPKYLEYSTYNVTAASYLPQYCAKYFGSKSAILICSLISSRYTITGRQKLLY